MAADISGQVTGVKLLVSPLGERKKNMYVMGEEGSGKAYTVKKLMK